MSADIGDGMAARCRAAEDYAAVVLSDLATAEAGRARFAELLELQLRRRVALRQAIVDLRGLLDAYPADRAIGSRDFGRGYALATRDVTALLDQLLKEHP